MRKSSSFDARTHDISLAQLSKAGKWRGEIPLPDRTSLEQLEENLEDGSNDKKAFIRFMQKMLQWQPEDRHTAKQLLEDDWLNGRRS